MWCFCHRLSQYRVIRKFLRDFRPRRYSSRDAHAEGEHVNRGRDTPSFCPTVQVLNMSTLGDAADVNHLIKFLPHTLHVCGRNLITGYCTAEVGNPGGTYELPCISQNFLRLLVISTKFSAGLEQYKIS